MEKENKQTTKPKSKKSNEEASELFHNIMKASVTIKKKNTVKKKKV